MAKKKAIGSEASSPSAISKSPCERGRGGFFRRWLTPSTSAVLNYNFLQLLEYSVIGGSRPQSLRILLFETPCDGPKRHYSQLPLEILLTYSIHLWTTRYDDVSP
jgi:hypothetical protein